MLVPSSRVASCRMAGCSSLWVGFWTGAAPERDPREPTVIPRGGGAVRLSSTKMPGRPGFPATRPAPENETARRLAAAAAFSASVVGKAGTVLAARAFLSSSEVTKGSSCHEGNASSLSFSVPGASKPFRRRRKKSTTIVILSLSNHSKPSFI